MAGDLAAAARALAADFAESAAKIADKTASWFEETGAKALDNGRNLTKLDEDLGGKYTGATSELDGAAAPELAGGGPASGPSALRQRIADILGPGETVPGERVPYTGAGSLSPEEQEAQDAAEAAQAYQRIRGATGDTQRISANTGIDESVLSRVKSHLFEQQHELPMPPDGHLVTQPFTPDKSISDLWEKADAGTLTAQEREQFQGLMQHESVESSLMAQGLPYRSADPGAWQDGINWPSADHYGAHDLAPHAAYPNDPWRGWRSMGFGDPPTTPIARDLSNVDAVIADIRQRMGI